MAKDGSNRLKIKKDVYLHDLSINERVKMIKRVK